MNNWKIGTRIAAGFGVVILIATALGLLVFNQAGSIQQNHASLAVLALAGAAAFALAETSRRGASTDTGWLVSHLSPTVGLEFVCTPPKAR